MDDNKMSYYEKVMFSLLSVSPAGLIAGHLNIEGPWYSVVCLGVIAGVGLLVAAAVLTKSIIWLTVHFVQEIKVGEGKDSESGQPLDFYLKCYFWGLASKYARRRYFRRFVMKGKSVY